MRAVEHICFCLRVLDLETNTSLLLAKSDNPDVGFRAYWSRVHVPRDSNTT